MSGVAFSLVIIDSAGGITRRIPVKSSTVRTCIAFSIVTLAAIIGVTAHGAWLGHRAERAQKLADARANMNDTLAAIAATLPKARLGQLMAAEEFGQIWSKAGLSPSSGAPDSEIGGIGPLADSDVRSSQSATNVPAANEISVHQHHHGDLPRKIVSLIKRSRALQDKLGISLDFFHDAELLLRNTPSVRPVDTRWITSRFGRRQDPINGQLVMHKGIDIGGYIGLAILAPADGQVIATGYRGGYGRTVVLDHGYGIQTHFAHLSKWLVKRGQKVLRGTQIAEMGSTGKSTGPHLHYEVRRYGEPIDPMNFILD